MCVTESSGAVPRSINDKGNEQSRDEVVMGRAEEVRVRADWGVRNGKCADLRKIYAKGMVA